MLKRYTTVATIALILLAVYTRTVGLDWGLPYPFHPDERNIADGILRLECPFEGDTMTERLQSCMNPGFYAYGQAPIYVGYVGIQVWHALVGKLGTQPTFIEAIVSLRIQSVVYSLLTLYVLYLIVGLLIRKMKLKKSFSLKTIALLGLSVFIFQPYFIQFSHFGTTESLLMLLYSSVIYISMLIYEKLTVKNAIVVSVLLGISAGVKISSLFFTLLPGLVVVYYLLTKTKGDVPTKVQSIARYGLLMIGVTLATAVVTSPHYLLNYTDFLSSMNYEISVGNGLPVFYTRQFELTLPYIFQFAKIFPYSHGFLQLALFTFGFILLPWKNPYVNILRLAFLLFFVPTGGVYTKWARFMAPVMPVMTLIAFVYVIKQDRVLFRIVPLIFLVIAGLSYLNVYRTEDVRFQASRWMAENIAPGSQVMIETANVVNLPVTIPYDQRSNNHMQVTVVDPYNADRDVNTRQHLIHTFNSSDYVVIASRRVFANHTCWIPDRSVADAINYQVNPLFSGKSDDWCDYVRETYPLVNELFAVLNNTSRYELVATFTDFPQISLFGQVLYEINDEQAEEAWTVFDHPVVRIYKRV